jgi:hypothetical protein
MTEPAITLEPRDGRRVVRRRLSVLGVSLLVAALLAILSNDDEGPDDVLARIHRPTGPGPGGEQRSGAANSHQARWLTPADSGWSSS